MKPHDKKSEELQIILNFIDNVKAGKYSEKELIPPARLDDSLAFTIQEEYPSFQSFCN